MKSIKLVCAAIAAAFITAASATPSFSQSDRYVSATGSDSNACTITAPCATMTGAQRVTPVEGIIHCLNTNNYGSVTILTSITIDCSGTNAVIGPVVINTPGIIVRIRGVTMGPNLVGSNIDFQKGGALIIENCNIFDSFNGIMFEPSSSARLYVSKSTIHDNEMGINIAPPPGGAALAVIDDVKLIQNGGFGLLAQGSLGGSVNVSVRDSVASYNGAAGFSAATGGGSVQNVLMKIERSESSHNSSDGIRANGTSVFVAGSTVMDNQGIGFGTYSGGTITSFGDNINVLNQTPGAPTGSAGFM